MMDEKFTFVMSEEEEEEEEKEEEEVEDDGGKSEPPETFLSALEAIDTVRKYLVKSDLIDNMMIALSSIGNKV
jgi:hypothetical protein